MRVYPGRQPIGLERRAGISGQPETALWAWPLIAANRRRGTIFGIIGSHPAQVESPGGGKAHQRFGD
jgi:hypothetical protein